MLSVSSNKFEGRWTKRAMCFRTYSHYRRCPPKVWITRTRQAKQKWVIFCVYILQAANRSPVKARATIEMHLDLFNEGGRPYLLRTSPPETKLILEDIAVLPDELIQCPNPNFTKTNIFASQEEGNIYESGLRGRIIRRQKTTRNVLQPLS